MNRVCKVAVWWRAVVVAGGILGERLVEACPGSPADDCVAPGSCDDGCSGAGGGPGGPPPPPPPGSPPPPSEGPGAPGGPAPHGKGPSTSSNFAVGSPVTGRNGRFLYHHIDLTVDSPGIPFAFTRYYNSMTGVKGPFGIGWSHSYHYPLTVNGDGSVKILNPRLETLLFLPGGNGTFQSTHPSLGYELTTSTAGHYILHKDKLDYSFDANRRLTAISDVQGRTTSLAYSTATSDAQWGPLLTTITDSVSRTYSLTWTQDDEHSLNGFPLPEGPHYTLTKLTENATGREFTFISGGVLTLCIVLDSAYGDSIEGPSIGITHGYQLTPPSYSLLSVIDRAGREEYDLTYDSVGGVATFKEGVEPLIAYTRNTTESYTIATQSGSTNRLEYTTTNQLLREIAYDGTIQTLTWDEDFHHPVSRVIVDPRGYTTTIVYDTSCGCGDTRPSSITDPHGGVTAFTYDDRQNLTSRTDPLGRTTTYEWNSLDQLLTEVDPLSQTTSYSYNAMGLVATKTDAAGGVTSYSYDSFGRLTGVTNPAGGVTQLEVNDAGFVTERTSPGGSVESFTRDAAGRILAHSNPVGNVTTYSYDGVDRVLTATTFRGHKSTNVWASNGPALSWIYRPLCTQQFTTDSHGNVTQDSAASYLTHEFDAWHSLLVTRRDEGTRGALVYSHDAVGNTTGVCEVAGPLEGDPFSASGALTRYDYDGLNRITRIVHTDGGTITRTFDAAGDVTAESDPAGNVTNYAHDALNRRVRRTAPLGRVTEWEYDSLGRKVSESDPAGHVTTFSYDILSRLKGTSDPMSHVTTFSYNADGDLTGIRDARGNVWSFGYDAAHRLKLESTPLSQVTTYSYDPDGNLAGKRDARGQVTTWVYDANQRLSSVTTADGGVVNLEYTSDCPGDIESITSPGHSLTQDWANRRLARKSFASEGHGQATIDYEYDDARRKKTVTWQQVGTNESSVSEYVRDSRGQVTQLLAKFGAGATRTTTYTYGVRGERLSVSRPNGVVTTYAFNAAGEVTNIRHASGSGQTLGSFEYQYSSEGLRVGRTTPAGQETYQYDSAHRLVSSTSATEAETFAYDAVGNLEGISNAAGLRVYAHDEANRLVSESGATPATYVFDAKGYPLHASAGLGAMFRKRCSDAGFWPPRAVVQGFRGRRENAVVERVSTEPLA